LAWGADASRGRTAARTAYAVSLGLWCGFLLADEIFVAFQVADTHMRLLIANVVCLAALSLRLAEKLASIVTMVALEDV
jgi:hypothetical protein